MRYTPYGAVRAAGYGNGLDVDEGFTGQTDDPGTGLIDYNARHYDPQLGRFIMADPILDGLNRYSYVHNNPLRYTDPTGNCVNPDGSIMPYAECMQGRNGEGSPAGAGHDAGGGGVIEPLDNTNTGSSFFGDFVFGFVWSPFFAAGNAYESVTNPVDTATALVYAASNPLGYAIGVYEACTETAVQLGACAGEAVILGGTTRGLRPEARPVAPGPLAPRSGYVNITRKSSLPNVATNVSRSAFEQELLRSGFRPDPRGGRNNVTNYHGPNGQRFSVRDNAGSTGGPTADFYPVGRSGPSVKIRLNGD